MKIQVTQADIANGMRGNRKACPIARAVIRASSLSTASVTQSYIRRGRRKDFTPAEARIFIRAFDAGQPVEPFEFEL